MAGGLAKVIRKNASSVIEKLDMPCMIGFVGSAIV